IWRVADVDHGQRIPGDRLEAPGPACVAQSRPYGGLKSRIAFGRLRKFQPVNEQHNRDSRIVDLKAPGQGYIQRGEIQGADGKIKLVAVGCRAFARDLDVVANE